MPIDAYVKLESSGLCGRLAKGDTHALPANSITSVKDHGVLDKVTNRGQFHASRSMNTKINTHSSAPSIDFTLRHRELMGFQVPEGTKPFFNGRTKRGVVNLAGIKTDHRLPFMVWLAKISLRPADLSVPTAGWDIGARPEEN